MDPKKTLEENGPILPIGITVSGNLVKSFELRPYKTKTDRALAIWREANENKTVAHLIPKYLSLVISKVGDTPYELDADGNSSAAQELMFHNWNLVDVFYAYVYSRVKHLGGKVLVPYVCPVPKCGAKDRGTFNIATADVVIANSIRGLVRWVDLKRGFQLRDGKQCTSVKIQPVTWQTMLAIGAGQSAVGTITYSSMQSAICGVNKSEKPYTLSEAEVDEIEKIDLVTIDRSNDQMGIGLSLDTEVPCKECGYVISGALDWSFDDFFGESFPLD
jgi:hypothetical protein